MGLHIAIRSGRIVFPSGLGYRTIHFFLACDNQLVVEANIVVVNVLLLITFFSHASIQLRVIIVMDVIYIRDFVV